MSGAHLGRGRGSRRQHDDARSEAADDVGDAPHRKPQRDDPERRARDIVYRLLAARARSHFELSQSLLRRGVDEDTAEAVLQKFHNAGLIDDAAFAESWVEQRHRGQGLGRGALEHELRRKGVDDSVTDAALSTVDDAAEEQRARELVRRKLRTMAVTDDTTRLRRLLAMLARKGYSESLAFRVAKGELNKSEVDTDAYDAGMS